MKYIMFSRYYPKGHFREGQFTNFVELIWSAYPPTLVKEWKAKFDPESKYFDYGKYGGLYNTGGISKGTTIRAGFRWNVGDVFQPRIWTGKPYASKQVAFMPELKVLGVQKFERRPSVTDGKSAALAHAESFLNDVRLTWPQFKRVAEHDGLSGTGLMEWLDVPFIGQRIIFRVKALDDTIF